MYLASDPDGSGPWLYSMDVERRIPHRLTSGLDRYTSLAASADGRRLVATLASPKRTLWRLRIADSPAELPARCSNLADDQHRVLPTTGSELSSLCFCDRHRARVSGSSPTEPARSCGVVEERESLAARQSLPMDGTIAFSVRQHGQTLLYVMQADGTNARIVADSLDSAGRSSMGARRPIDHLGGGRSRRPTPLPRADRRSPPPLLLSGSTRSIPRGRPTAASLSTRDPTSAPRFR